jgi:serine/threonine-protein kinase
VARCIVANRSSYTPPGRDAAGGLIDQALQKAKTMDEVKLLDEKYELVREIKRGGFGVVYYGRDRLFGKPVAIKAISPDLLGEAKYIDIFQAESLSVARLNHHNIVRLYDIKRTGDGQFYIIMEFIDGVDLRKLISASRKAGFDLPFHFGAHIIAQICLGLDYAHARRDPDTHQPLNIVHQDVSPSNIMVNRQGEVKIIDFGMASARRRSTTPRGRKREILLQGKISYVAPEQINGKAVDRRSDIFCLGLVLYEVLSGQRLMNKEKPAEVINMLDSGAWSFAVLAEKQVPEPLQLIVQRAVQKEPENRYQTANQMYLDLMAYLATQESGTDISSALSQLIERLNPAKTFVTEERIEEPSTEKLRSLYRETSPENSNRLRSVPDSDRAAAAVDLETTVEAESSAAKQDRDQRNNEAADHFEASSEDEYFQETKPAQENAGQGAGTSETRIQDVPFYRILDDDEEEEDEQRTIIDVIRLSTRSHKKAILVTLASFVSGFLLFTVLDTAMRWTGYGAAIDDMLFPPAIRLISFPPDAQVYLDDKLLTQTTPLSIEKISPGVHKLMLLLPRYEPIVRSIQVPPKGRIIVEGDASAKGNQPYIFRFKTTLELSSKPPGAEVYLNGIKYTQPTPCRVVWEVGDPLQIEMEKPGFARLSGFTLNTLEGVESIEDRRLWHFQRIEPEREHFAIEGTFAKAVVLTSIPDNAEIYLDGSERPVGVTGFTSRLLLTMGLHTVSLKKRNYLSKTFTIRIDENTPDQFQETLYRVVKVFAKDASDPGDNDIGANLLHLTYENNTVRVPAATPCELTLLPFKYTAQLRKDGYKDYTLVIPAAAYVVVARMERIQVSVELLVLDEAAGTPLENVEISCYALRKPEHETIFDLTDVAGASVHDLPPGEYRFIARKSGYQDATKDLLVTANHKNRLVIKMRAM